MPGDACSAGVSTSTKPRSAKKRRVAAVIALRASSSGRRDAWRSGRHQGVMARLSPKPEAVYTAADETRHFAKLETSRQDVARRRRAGRRRPGCKRPDRRTRSRRRALCRGVDAGDGGADRSGGSGGSHRPAIRARSARADRRAERALRSDRRCRPFAGQGRRPSLSRPRPAAAGSRLPGLLPLLLPARGRRAERRRTDARGAERRARLHSAALSKFSKSFFRAAIR